MTAVLQTFSALLFAHVIGDFLLQTRWMVARKRNVFVLLLHVVLHGVATTLALGGLWQLALIVMLSHLLIDLVKTYAPRRYADTLPAYLGDQLLHLVALAVVALHWPVAQAGWLGPWMAQLTPFYLTVSGALMAVIAGGFAVGLVTRPFIAHLPSSGLPEAGRLIGQLERALIFLLILVDQPAAIGFLIAAKSILRFNDASEDQKTAEYVIIGTLASFLWALGCGYTVTALLEIAASSP